MARLQDLVAVITGGGSGIGRCSALAFADEGASVVVADIHASAAEETAQQIRSGGGKAEVVSVDVTQYDQVERMIATAIDRFGRLDVLFNNAGWRRGFTPFEESTDDLYNRIFDVNVKGVFYGCRAAIPQMKAHGGGVILNTASTAGIRPRPGLAVYNASKGAVITLTKALAIELAPYRIRVVSICPVATDTPMLPSFIGVEQGADEAEGRRRFIGTIPWGRLNRSEDIAHAAVFRPPPTLRWAPAPPS